MLKKKLMFLLKISQKLRLRFKKSKRKLKRSKMSLLRKEIAFPI